MGKSWFFGSEAQMYTGLMDSAREAGAKLQNVVQKVAGALRQSGE